MGGPFISLPIPCCLSYFQGPSFHHGEQVENKNGVHILLPIHFHYKSWSFQDSKNSIPTRMFLLCVEFLTSYITVVLLCVRLLTLHVTVVMLHVQFLTSHFTVVMLYVQFITSYLIVSVLYTFPNFTSDIFIISVYITNFTCTHIYTHQTLVNLLHVSAWHRCLHLGVLLVAIALKDSLIMAPLPCQNM